MRYLPLHKCTTSTIIYILFFKYYTFSTRALGPGTNAVMFDLEIKISYKSLAVIHQHTMAVVLYLVSAK